MPYKLIIKDDSTDDVVNDLLLNDSEYQMVSEFIQKVMAGVVVSYPLSLPVNRVKLFKPSTVKALEEYSKDIYSGCPGPMTLADLLTFSENDLSFVPGITATDVDDVKSVLLKIGGYTLRPQIYR